VIKINYNNKNYNNDCTNVLILWINQRSGKTYMGVQQNPNITYSGNKASSTGVLQRKSEASTTYNENWVYGVKKRYEQSMSDPREKYVPMTDEFYADLATDTFSSILIYFMCEQEGFDFRNQLFGILSQYNLTYNKNMVSSKINKTDNPPRVFNILSQLDQLLQSGISNIPLVLEQMFHNFVEDGVYSENDEDVSMTNNMFTREELGKGKSKTILKKFCKHCGVEVSKTRICSGFNCDYSGEKVEVVIKELIK